jgi:hypothetical protein
VRLGLDLAFAAAAVLALRDGGLFAPPWAFLMAYLGRIGLVAALLPAHALAPPAVRRHIEWLCPPLDEATRFAPRDPKIHGAHLHLAVLLVIGVAIVSLVALWQGSALPRDGDGLPEGALLAGVEGAALGAGSYLMRSLVLRRIHIDFSGPRAWAWEDAFQETLLTTIAIWLLLSLSIPFFSLLIWRPGTWGAWVPAALLVVSMHFHRPILDWVRRVNGGGVESPD